MKNTYLDIGSTSIKWLKQGEPCFSEVCFPKKTDLKPPYFEVPVKKIWEIIEDIIKDETNGRLFISVQMHGYILLDKNSVEITEYISWQDCRSELVKIPFIMKPENGVSLKPNLPKAGVYAIKLLQPQIYSNAAEFCTLGSYIIKKLTGLNKTHITDAAASGFFNVNGKNEKHDLILPDAHLKVKPVGNTDNIIVYTPVGDQQAAVLGSGADENCYVMNIGTAGQLCCINSSFIKGDFESRPFFEGKTLCTVTNLPGGKAITMQNGKWTEHLYNEYALAMKKLPKKSRMLVTGGFAKRYREELIKVLNKFNLPFAFSGQEDAIEGLAKIAKSIEDQ